MEKLKASTLVPALAWKEVVSATTGGKPCFFVAFPVMNLKRRKYTVAWERDQQRWEASFDDFETCLVPESHGLYATVKEAKAACEADYAAYIHG